MPCKAPNIVIRLDSVNVETGNQRIKFDGPATTERINQLIASGTSFFMVPCGKCEACRIKHSRDWANRLMMELPFHDSAYFITLTYNDAHVPHAYITNCFGEAVDKGLYTLQYSDVQGFFHRLRKRFPDDKIKYYVCGEYGPTTKRPHYHAIVFGLHLDDLVPFKMNEFRDPLFTSQKLQNVWSDFVGYDEHHKSIFDPFGFVLVGKVCWNTCAYVARYCTKKFGLGTARYYINNGLQPEFSHQSTRPAISRDYFDLYKEDIVNFDKIYLSSDRGSISFRSPRYFEKLIASENPELGEARSAQRMQAAIDSMELVKHRIDKDYFDYLDDLDEILCSKTISLDRSEN